MAIELPRDAFESFYRRYADSCTAAGIEPRSREYTEAMLATWDRIFRTPAHALQPIDAASALTEQ